MPKKEATNIKNTLREEPEETIKKPAKAPREKTARPKKEQAPKAKSVNNPFRGTGLFLKNEKFQKVTGLFMLLFSFYLAVSFTSYLFSWKADDNIFNQSLGRILIDNTLISENWMGKIGSLFAYIFIKRWFGIASYFFIFLFFISGIKLFLNITILPLGKSYRYSLFAMVWISILMGLVFTAENQLILGGIFGYQVDLWMANVIGKTGIGLILFFSLASFLIIEYNIHLKWKKKPVVIAAAEEDDDEDAVPGNTLRDELPEEEPEVEPGEIELVVNNKPVVEEKPDEALFVELDPSLDGIEFTVQNAMEEEPEPALITDNTEHPEHFGIDTEYDPTLELSSYQFPPIELLKEYDSGNVTVQNEELEANKKRIITTLNNYSISIDRINATIGPTVTLYEIVPSAGVRISKIKNLEDDIALSLSALGIRIIAPMPGKGTIGIEVPNQNPKIVSMRSIITSDDFQNSKFDLPIGLGKTISNKPFIADLAKMPHLLMAGATGQGKSVGLNAIITSIVYKKHPSQVKFVMVDPKKVELTLFSKIERHFLAKLPDAAEAIITDVRQVVCTLNALCIEMDERYDLLKSAGVRNIKEYNGKFISRKLNPNDGHKFLPYIILIVDEFADLFLTAGKEVELPITRLAQLARAIGIHLIVATQRPSVNIITGTIKANFPARLAFRVISKVDSRTILDSGGADQLIGRGDMLLSTGSDLIRLQCPFVDTPEVEEITEFIGNQRGYNDAHLLPECNDEEGESSKSVDAGERDDFFEEAARLIVSHQHGSTSLLQRKLKLGYNRAGRIVDQLEAAGIIGPFEGSKAREVKIKDMTYLEQYLKSLSDNNI
ncbi:MAG: DNA translocase FtsK [Bacteroidota bacterium]